MHSQQQATMGDCLVPGGQRSLQREVGTTLLPFFQTIKSLLSCNLSLKALYQVPTFLSVGVLPGTN